MLMPKRMKHRKRMEGKRGGKAFKGGSIEFGEYGLKSQESAWITARQIEAARVAITRRLKRAGKVWIRIFPHMPKTKKPAETRMGSGKGSPEEYVAVIKSGTVLFEVEGVPTDLAKEALRLAGHKLPVKTRFVTRHDQGLI